MGAQGTADLDFGAFPGKTDAKVDITGQTGIVSGSLAEAWIRPVNTADHYDEEHMVEDLRIYAGNITPGTGFTVFGYAGSSIGTTLIYGVWKIGWVWN